MTEISEHLKDIIYHGDILNSIGIYQSALRNNNEITKKLFIELVKLNYDIKTEISQHLLWQIDNEWIKSKRILKNLKVLKSFSKNRIKINSITE